MADSVFRTMFEQSPFSIQVLTPDGHTVMVNSAWEELWGVTLAQVGDYNMLRDEQLAAKGVLPYIQQAFAGRATTIPPILYDPQPTIHNGRPRWVRAFIYPMHDEDGVLQHVVLVHEDITQHVRRDEALRKSREQLSAILNGLADSITVQDRNGHLVYANTAAARSLGYPTAAALLAAPPREIMQQFEILDEDGRPFPLEHLPGRQVLQGGSSAEATIRFRVVATGEEHWSTVRATPVLDDRGELLYAINFFDDITERKHTEIERLHLLQRVEAERSLLETVLQQLPAGVVIAEAPSGKLILGNEQVAQIWRHPFRPSADIKGYEEWQGFHADGRPLQSEEWPLARSIATGETVTEEDIDILRGDGTRATIRINSTPVRDDEGHIVAGVIAFYDISERKQAEEKIRFQAHLLDAVGQSVIATDVEGRIIYWNHASKILYGWTHEEVSGRYATDVIATASSAGQAIQIMAELQAGGSWSGEFEVRHRDGRTFPVLISVTPVYDESGALIGIIGVFTDLSERKRIEEGERFLAEAGAVLSSSLDYGTTLESVARLAVPTLADWCTVDMTAGDGTIQRLAVAHVDPDKVQWAYEISRRFPPQMDSPYGVPNVLRTGLSELFPEITDDLLVETAQNEELLAILREVGMRSALVVPLCARGRTLGAITFIYAESGRRYDHDDLALAEELARRAALAVDNARLYQEAEQARDAAETANRAKDEFLALVSHELRTPLTSMLGWTGLLLSGRLGPQDEQQAIEIIDRNTKAQAKLINDLLDVSRIITGKLRLNITEVELKPIIEAAVDSVRPAAEAKELQLQLVLDPWTGPISGDAGRLQQVIWNLLSNAVKFTPPGGSVEVRLARVNSHVAITISDTGHGISPEFLPYVFDRFRQADSSSTRLYGGLGVGLAIVRHLVELHGGTVQAGSEGEDQGATFTVRLPLPALRAHGVQGLDGVQAPGHPFEQASPVENRSVQSQENSSRPAQPDAVPDDAAEGLLAGLRVVVVEDDADARELVKVVLVQEGAQVRAVVSAAAAFREVRQWRPDVLVSDIGMPDEDGYALMAQVRALAPEEGGNTPAIALTAYSRTQDRVRALSVGYQIHVPKPAEPVELVAAVASVTGRTGKIMAL
jgi:PAS domain S-box-containing protein